VISHDRWFLDALSRPRSRFEDDAVVRWFEGNFSDYEASATSDSVSMPISRTRLRYKPITR